MRVPACRLARGLAVVLVASATGVGAVGAQAPHITPSGDPSIRSDTIYSLAVRPQDYPDQSVVYLLEDGVVRFEEDGRSRRTYRVVAQILTPQGAEQWGDPSLPYTTGRQRVTLNWLRVLRLNGSVISDKPSHVQESIAPVAQEAPVYSDTRVRQFTLSGVAPNTIVDYSYTIEDTKPFVPGDFWTTWAMGAAHVTRRSRFVVDVPASLTPRIQERNVHFARLVTQSHGRRVYVWAANDIPRPIPEPFAPDTSALYPQIAVAAPISWEGIASWYAALTRKRYRLTPALTQQLATVVQGSETLEDSLRAVYQWVAQDFRYVSLPLGLGAYLPRMPMSVWETKYGDCKDKATLFIALVRHMGVAAYPVLLSSTGGVNRSMPSAHQLDHMIAAIVRGRSGDVSQRFLFADLTSDLTPFGSLPPSEQGEFALVVYPDGSGEEVTLPSDPVAVNRATIQISGTLSPDMTFSGRYQEVATGNRQYTLRSAFATAYGAADRARMARNIANALFDGASGDSLVLFNGRDLEAEPKVALSIRDARLVSSAGAGTKILTLPVRNYARPDILAELEARDYRRSPIDAESVVGPYEETSEFHLLLPAGWQARLPADVDASSVFGHYRAHYSQVGRELTVQRSIMGATGVQPPQRITQLIAWLKAIGQDDIRYIAIETGENSG